jgi:hypothetical protein
MKRVRNAMVPPCAGGITVGSDAAPLSACVAEARQFAQEDDEANEVRMIDECLRLWDAYFAETGRTCVESLGGFWEVVAAVRELAARRGWRTRRQQDRLWFSRGGRRFCITYPTPTISLIIRRSDVRELAAAFREVCQ